MTFLNLALAFGAAAFAIPLVIHLLNRSRFTVVRWGAMHLLEPVVKVNRKRVKLEQLTLLLVRMLIPVLLAWCMAGPVLTGCRSLAGDAKASLVVLFDNSYSMEAGGEAASNLDVAAEEAGALIRKLPRGSDLTVVLLAGGSVTGSGAPTTDLPRAAEEIVALGGGFGRADVAGSLEGGALSLASMQHSKRDVVILSDFQSGDWTGGAAPARQRAQELIEALPVKPSLTLFQVGNEVTENACVRSLDVSPGVVGIGQEVQVRANLRNTGKVPFPALRVYFRVDGEDRDLAGLSLGPGEDGQVLFRHTFADPGSHVIEVYADADALEADNGYLASVTVWDRIPIALVDGDPGGGGLLGGETSFLEVALSPFLAARSGRAAAAGLPPADLIEAETVDVRRLGPRQLEARKVLVLADVPRLSGRQREELEQFVSDGGALLVFAGDRVDTGWYNGELWDAGRGLLPLEITGQGLADETLPAVGDGGGGGDEPGIAVADGHLDHPALALFNDRRNGDLTGGRVTRWLVTADAATPAAG